MTIKKAASALLLFAICGSIAAYAQRASVAEIVDHQVKGVESEFVPAAEVMPENQYSFAPTNGEFKGVRTFGQQVKHVAAVNYELAAAILGERPPADSNEEKGPASMQSKAEILTYLKGSFQSLHKAIASISEKNMTEPVKNPWGEKDPVNRLGLAIMAAGHPWDHYGQMVEYLRMNGIVPPASR